MSFWTKEKIIEAYPYCKFYNMPFDWSGLGLKIWHDDFEDGNMTLLRMPDEKKGVIKPNWDLIIDKSSALICSKGNAQSILSYGKPVIEVENTNDFILACAKYIRNLYAGKVIAVTGSSGKSTTVKMVYDILKNYSVSCNLNKANTSWGIGWNLTNFCLEDPYWVVETSAGGGMMRNSSLTKPDIAIVTTIAPVHLDEGKTLRDLAFIKSKIFYSMEEGSVAVIYNEIPYFDIFEDAAREKGLKIITVGEAENSNIRVIADSSNIFVINGKSFEIEGKLLAKHILLDMGMAIASVTECGISPEEAIEKLQSFKPLSGRGEVIECKIAPDKKITIVDESYNANPVSMKAALEGFYRQFGSNSSILILGEMTEGGSDSEKYHLELENTIRKVKPSRIILCSSAMKPLWDVLKSDFAGEYYENVDDLNKDIINWLKDGDHVLIKSSNSIGLHKTVSLLKTLVN